jgi:ribosomal protein S18 acetylase RimI-like enzyme
MEDSIQIRDFIPEDRDYEAVARLNALAWSVDFLDFEPPSAAELRAFDRAFDPARYSLRRFVAEEAGAVVGYAYYAHMPWAFDPRAYWASVRCDAAHRGRGIGRRLYEHVMGELARIGAQSVRMEAREADPIARGALERRGFVEEVRSSEYVLETGRANLEAFRGYAERAAAEGIEIISLPALKERDPAWLSKLHALHTAVIREIPLPDEPTERSPAELVDYLFNAPGSLPEACFIALHGDRYVGECILYRIQEEGEEPELDHLVTGVDKEFRGRGVAVALKLRTIELAQKNGYAWITTWVESNNPSMLAVNEKLGFVRGEGLLVLKKSPLP